MKTLIKAGVSLLALTLSGAALAQSNSSDVEQTASLNSATVTQVGANCSVIVTQGV
jgi:hypothetical protein